jgi:hypothetical protein
LLNTTSRVVGQAKRFSAEIVQGVKRTNTALKQLALEGLREELDEMSLRVRQVSRQTRARIFHDNTRSEGKLLSRSAALLTSDAENLNFAPESRLDSLEEARCARSVPSRRK